MTRAPATRRLFPSLFFGLGLGLGPCPGRASAQTPTPLAVDREHILAVIDAEQLDAVALMAIVQDGALALPVLLEALSADWTEPVPRRQHRALRILRLMGPPVADAVLPTLFARIGRDAARDDVELLDTIAMLVPGLTERQRHRDDTRSLRIDPPQAKVLDNDFRRWVAKMRLWYRIRQYFQGDAPTALPELVALLDNEDPLRRERAAWALGRMGPQARGALDALVRTEATTDHPRISHADVGNLTADHHDLVRDAAAIAIARIDPSRPEARRGLVLLMLRADSPQERVGAAMAIATARPRVEDFDVAPALLEATRSDDLRVAGEAITALGTMPASILRRSEVVARLRECTTSPDRGIAGRARVALRSADPQASGGK